MKTIEEAIGDNIAWLQTMKQKNGYAGPVVHYWYDCLNYIGPGLDWRYEGLITAYITLYEKTGNKFFLEFAIESGDHLVKQQFPNSSFRNSNFEANPSFRSGGTPHESAACIGLLRLAKKLKEENLNWEIYFSAAKKNMDLFHLRDLWNEKTKTFFQYRHDRETHVPNKIATITEFLLLLYEFTKDKKYIKYALWNADYIVSQQDIDRFYGGIYQSDKHRRIITYYTARCIPALIQVYELSDKEKYIDASIHAAEFIKTMENDEGGFYFGYMKNNDEFKLYKYPIWIAGSADIVRSLLQLKKYKKFEINKNINWILKNIDENGGIRTSYGINHKNKIGEYNNKPSWRDVLHVVGWNDKALRLFSELLEKNSKIEIGESTPIEVACSDGTYYEDNKLIRIEGKENYIFKKNSLFSNYEILRKLIMDIGFIYSKYKKSYSFEYKILDLFGLRR